MQVGPFIGGALSKESLQVCAWFAAIVSIASISFVLLIPDGVRCCMPVLGGVQCMMASIPCQHQW